jgi:autotransporter-associated beta strand protein
LAVIRSRSQNLSLFLKLRSKKLEKNDEKKNHMRTRMKTITNIIYPAFALFAFACFAVSPTALGDCVQPTGSATWDQSPFDGAWDRCENWAPQTVPNGDTDVATFGSSNFTNVSGFWLRTLASIVFDGGTSYTVSPSFYGTDIVGAGVINNSGLPQHIVGPGSISFRNSATAGDANVIYDGGAGFYDTSSAGHAIFPDGFAQFSGNSSAGNGIFIMPGTQTVNGYPSGTGFADSSTAANGVFTCFGGAVVPGNGGGSISFGGSSTAGYGTCTANGATINGGGGGLVWFSETSSGANATLIANSGVTDDDAGRIQFSGDSTGGFARVEVFDNGYLLTVIDLTIGSLEGTGKVLIESDTPTPNALTIGSNSLSTSFSGVIQDSGLYGGSSVGKIGTGTLTLSGANTYTGGTTVNEGTLLITSRRGSGTGTGPVQVNAGTLGGTGKISGNVIVGTGTGPGAFLSPGVTANAPGILTIQKRLIFNADSTYSYGLKTRTATADQVVAKGVTIHSGFLFSFLAIGNTTLAPGTIFTVINNTAAIPIAGTFANLADGSTFTVGRNTFQVNYEGGTGNDLTLTVVP